MKQKQSVYTSGEGTERSPYHSKDGTAGLAQRLEAVADRGGRVFLPIGRYEITNTVTVDTPCTMLEGEVWNYSADPNGVFESSYGTKLRMKGRDFPALSVGRTRVVGGAVIQNIGVQGDLVGMDTRTLYDPLCPSAASGLYFGGSRVDQGEFSKLSFCGLGVGICADGNSEIDACLFDRFNADGCCVGVYFAPVASYYARFQRGVVADTPSYGVFVDGGVKKNILELTVEDITLTRNCGSMPQGNDATAAAVYIRNVTSANVRGCTIDCAGTFWYFAPNATQNRQRDTYKSRAVGIRIESDGCRILDNIVNHSSDASISVKGNGNILNGNIVDGDVVIEGTGNTVSNLIFSQERAKLILVGCAAESTNLLGIPEERIVRMYSV